jgi:hypothetical protein
MVSIRKTAEPIRRFMSIIVIKSIKNRDFILSKKKEQRVFFDGGRRNR